MSVGVRSRRVDLLRGISICLVLLHHFNIAYRLDDTLPSQLFGWDAVRAVTRNGNYGVIIFFTVSGFLITTNAQRLWGSLSNVDAWAFYRRRVARIIPCSLLLLTIVNLLGACGLEIFQNHPEAGGPIPFWLVDLAALSFWMNVLMAHSGWLNYVLCVQWSLSVEEIFYVAFPIACLLLKRQSFLITLWLGFVVVGPLWRMAHQGDEAGFLYAYLACFDAIAIGCCTAVLSKHYMLDRKASRLLTCAVAAGMAALYLSRSIVDTNVYGVTLMAFGTAVLILSGLHQPTEEPVDGNIVVRLVRAGGRLSYELYLFHLLVLGALRTVWTPSSTHGDWKLLLLVAYLCLSQAVAMTIAGFYSEPLNRRLRRGSTTPLSHVALVLVQTDTSN